MLMQTELFVLVVLVVLILVAHTVFSIENRKRKR